MKYNYKCTNEDCLVHSKIQTIEKSISDVQKIELCKICKSPLQRVYTLAVKTGDGLKT